MPAPVVAVDPTLSSWSSIALFIGVIALVGIGLWAILRVRRSTMSGMASGAARVAVVPGPARCLEAIAQCRRLAASGDQEQIASSWKVLAAPLAEALSSCPPAVRPQLAQALTDLAESCRRSEVKAAIVTMRARLGEPVPG